MALAGNAMMKDEEKDTGRIEAFSDGVFAIAITLLALELKIPHSVEGGAEGLVHALVKQWPAYLSFVTSFCTILIMWGNHHEVFRLVRRTNTAFMLANGFLLMLVTVVPFTTALTSDYLTGPGAVVASAVYGGLFVLISIAYNLLWNAAVKGPALLRRGVPEPVIRKFTRNYRLGFPLYLLAAVGAFLHPMITIGICTALWIFWAFTMKREGTE
jgi:uncharacterized membrane protein